MIANLTLEEFAHILQAHVAPRWPVQLADRDAEIEPQFSEIERALTSPGRTIFIYSDDHIAGTSLAKAVAAQRESDREPVTVAPRPGTEVGVFIRDGAATVTDDRYANLEVSEKKRSFQPAEESADNVALLMKSGEPGEDDTLFVIDEFNQIKGDEERMRFSEFVRQLEDSRMPIRFIFCGVSRSLRQLLSVHESRYLENVELPESGATFKILDPSGEQVNAAVAHHIHLVSEKLFWQMLNEPTFARSLR